MKKTRLGISVGLGQIGHIISVADLTALGCGKEFIGYIGDDVRL